MVSAALQKSCGKIHAFVTSHGRLPQRKDAVEGGDTLARNLARLRSEIWPALTAEDKRCLLADFPLLRPGLESDDADRVIRDGAGFSGAARETTASWTQVRSWRGGLVLYPVVLM